MHLQHKRGKVLRVLRKTSCKAQRGSGHGKIKSDAEGCGEGGRCPHFDRITRFESRTSTSHYARRGGPCPYRGRQTGLSGERLRVEFAYQTLKRDRNPDT